MWEEYGISMEKKKKKISLQSCGKVLNYGRIGCRSGANAFPFCAICHAEENARDSSSAPFFFWGDLFLRSCVAIPYGKCRFLVGCLAMFQGVFVLSRFGWESIS